MKISASEQVAAWLQTLAPSPKQRVRSDLKLIENGKGDIKALQRELDGFYRLRSGGYRIIYRYQPGKSGPEIFLEFAEARDIVYEQFVAILSEEGRI